MRKFGLLIVVIVAVVAALVIRQVSGRQSGGVDWSKYQHGLQAKIDQAVTARDCSTLAKEFAQASTVDKQTGRLADGALMSYITRGQNQAQCVGSP